MSLFPSCHVRKIYYKCIGARIGRNVVFHFKTEIRDPHKLQIEEGSIVGDNAILDARNQLFIGKDVDIASNVSIYTDQHNYRSPNFDCSFPGRNMGVKIDDMVFIGCNVVILPGVHIGEGAVCCAGCVVSKDVEPYSVVAGIPAVKIGNRPSPMNYHFNGKSCRIY